MKPKRLTDALLRYYVRCGGPWLSEAARDALAYRRALKKVVANLRQFIPHKHPACGRCSLLVEKSIEAALAALGDGGPR